jgi:soluble lytic murein transglycosylase
VPCGCCKQFSTLVAASKLAAQHQLAIGRTAVGRHIRLDEAAFPIHGVPDIEMPGDVERAMIHAIARQESAFNPMAVSGAGARGLMQMMPATARETARRFALPNDPSRLTGDPTHSARLGAAHLADLMKEWRGSYILTFAAYNAGSGNVREWIAAYGDPRNPEVDAIDWIERIPFTETRHYVQKILENLQVYRARLHATPHIVTAQGLAGDMARGRVTTPAPALNLQPLPAVECACAQFP